MAGEDNFLSRWSRRKSESRVAAREEPPADEKAPEAPAVAAPAAPAQPAVLPPIDTLTPESDYSAFMSPEVDGDLRRKALKALFSDPRFNAMDMMDVYVDDYSKPDPLPDGWLEKLEQVSRLGDRAGRDREEAERRRALSEARAREEDGAGPAAGTPPETASPGDVAPPGEVEAHTPDAPAPIPSPRVGDSGT